MSVCLLTESTPQFKGVSREVSYLKNRWNIHPTLHQPHTVSSCAVSTHYTQEASRNAEQLLEAEEKAKREREKKRERNKKVYLSFLVKEYYLIV